MPQVPLRVIQSTKGLYRLNLKWNFPTDPPANEILSPRFTSRSWRLNHCILPNQLQTAPVLARPSSIRRAQCSRAELIRLFPYAYPLGSSLTLESMKGLLLLQIVRLHVMSVQRAQLYLSVPVDAVPTCTAMGVDGRG